MELRSARNQNLGWSINTNFPSFTHPQQTNLTLLYAEAIDKDHTAGLYCQLSTAECFTHAIPHPQLGCSHTFTTKASYRGTSSQSWALNLSAHP